VFDGGEGFDTLFVTTGGTRNLSNVTFESVEALDMSGGDGANHTVTLSALQLGNDQLSNALTVAGSTGARDVININGGGVANLAFWTLESWQARDVININGTGAVDRFTGARLSDVLTGLGGADRLNGGAGADTLRGGAGKDQLTGGAGNDKFVFNVAATAANADTVLDFRHGQDKINLENSVFSGLTAGTLTSAAFFKGANAHDANDRVIYNPADGKLYFDNDGNGAHAKVLIATLDDHLNVTASDIVVI
jgi:Ca2+-binding RTX toxin-like protein